MERKLTNQGTAQCMVARTEWFGRLPVRQLILASPSQCCVETAMHMSGRVLPSGHVDPDAPPLVLVPSLHAAGHHAAAETLFAQLRSGALLSFVDADGGEQAFGEYAELACAELTAAFRAKAKERETRSYVSVFGDSVYINAVAHAVASAAGAPPTILDKVIEIY